MIDAQSTTATATAAAPATALVVGESADTIARAMLAYYGERRQTEASEVQRIAALLAGEGTRNRAAGKPFTDTELIAYEAQLTRALAALSAAITGEIRHTHALLGQIAYREVSA